MRYPTALNNQDFLKYWYSAQDFGNPTTYGFHDGEDYNIKTGGNSDLGQPLYAVADGKIVYYHNASHPTTGFGRHMVLKCETSRGTRWYHYAHCQEITSTVKEVKEGDVIGKLGSTGNSVYAHLHFAVFKVDPSTLYKGIDSIAKYETDLRNWWERFELLSDNIMPENDDALTTCLADREKFWKERDEATKKADGLLDQTRKLADQIAELEGKFAGETTRANDEKEKRNALVEKMAQKLGTIVDEGQILKQIEIDVVEVDEIRKKANQLQKSYDQLERDKKTEIEALKKDMDLLRADNERQGKRIDTLDKRIFLLSEQNESGSLYTLVRQVLSLFKGKKKV